MRKKTVKLGLNYILAGIVLVKLTGWLVLDPLGNPLDGRGPKRIDVGAVGDVFWAVRAHPDGRRVAFSVRRVEPFKPYGFSNASAREQGAWTTWIA